MTDYKTLIDAETWAFIERTNSYYPPDTIDYTIAEQRAIYDRMCREFFAGYPEGVTAETTFIAGRRTTSRSASIAPPAPEQAAMVLYFHGGGFILGGLDSHDDVCAELCARTGYEVVSVDYRLAPEHLHPAAFDDALQRLRMGCRPPTSGQSCSAATAPAAISPPPSAMRRVATRASRSARC